MNFSIESIKKELVDKFMNNVEILNYLNANEWLEKNSHLQIKDLYNTLIYGYGIMENGIYSFVSVEVDESNIYNYTDGVHKLYTVSIVMGTRKEHLDKIASVITSIVLEAFPYMKNYSNKFDKEKYHRVITFDIED